MLTAAALWPLLLAASSPDECREAYAAVNYREATRLCVSALKVAQPVELPGLYRLAGLSFAALNDEPNALKLFISLLAMDPAAQLDPSISPKLRGPFEKAKALRRGAPVQLELQQTQGPAGEVALNDGPEHPVVSLSSQQDVEPPQKQDRKEQNVIDLHEGTKRVAVSAYDIFGGVLASATIDLKAPSRISWVPWAVVAGVVLAAAAGSAVASRLLFIDASHMQLVTDAERKLDYSNGTAIGADVGFGFGGAMALTALLIGVLQ
jgi:hypothetical protein